jgi:hypothetical protein
MHDMYDMQLLISDLTGRELLNEPMKQEHNINFLSPGVYIITLRKQGELVRSYKVVVSRNALPRLLSRGNWAKARFSLFFL